VQPSKIRSRLKAQLTRFTTELAAGLSKPLRNFVAEMLFGIQASQDVKLSNIARRLQEEIPLLKTEDRLSRNLQAEDLETHLRDRSTPRTHHGARHLGHNCGGDRRKLLEPLLERGARFVMRSTGQRMVLGRRRHRVTLHHLGARCRLRYQAQIIKIENGQEKIYQLRYGAEPFRLPGREEPLLLVVVAGFGQEPLLLLTNVGGVRDSPSLWWIAQIYLTRWKEVRNLSLLELGKLAVGHVTSQAMVGGKSKTSQITYTFRDESGFERLGKRTDRSRKYQTGMPLLVFFDQSDPAKSVAACRTTWRLKSPDDEFLNLD